jgi:serine/threonine protein kinase
MDIGEIFEAKYRVIKVLGRGGMGAVYLAENIKLGTLWAIKEINKIAESKIDLLVEPNILKKLNHPSLPRIFDIIEDERSIYIVVDFIEGTPLNVELSKVGRFQERLVINWAQQICDVLEYLHNIKPNPVIYRDMKPSNIILNEQGNIKLIDFGIAREFKDGLDDDTIYLGTRGFAAPEQYGLGQSNVTTDIYNLGITLFNLLTGIDPNNAALWIKDEDRKNVVISGELREIIGKCIQSNSKDRYQSVLELTKDLDRLLCKDNLAAEIPDISGRREVKNKSNSGKIVTFKKLVLTVWGNSEFAAEIAYISAKLTDFKVMLIDLDMLNPAVDIFLNLDIDRTGNGYGSGYVDCGLNRFLKTKDKSLISEDQILRESTMRKELRNLNILTGFYSVDINEEVQQENIIKLIEKAYQSFDLTILSVNKSIMDSLTVTALGKSDFNIIPIRADSDVLREYERYVSYLHEKKQIQNEKNKFVAFEYDENVNLSKDTLKNFFGKNFIGSIRYSEKRKRCRNLKVPYAKRMEKSVQGDYRELLSFFNVVPETSVLIKINEWLYNFSNFSLK